MSPTSRTVLLWVFATAAAIVIATIGVQAVTSPEPIPLLTAGESTPSATVAAGATASTDGPTHDATDDRGANSGHDGPDDDPSINDDPSDDFTPDDKVTPDDDRTPDDDPTHSVAIMTKTASSMGGSAAFQWDGTTIEVLWSTPEAGFTVEIHRDAADDVDVRFESASHESRIKADIEHGQLHIRVEERDED
jgi:hypothetical protein